MKDLSRDRGTDNGGEPLLSAPYVLEYTYTRSVGPIIGEFLTGLRAKRILGGRTPSGEVVVPPTEYCPKTGDTVRELVEVGQSGVVQTFAWVSEPRRAHFLNKPFAWALIKLDGADTAMLHAVRASDPEQMKTGMRVSAHWAESPKGFITDLAYFSPEAP